MDEASERESIARTAALIARLGGRAPRPLVRAARVRLGAEQAQQAEAETESETPAGDTAQEEEVK